MRKSHNEDLWDETAPYFHQLADLMRAIAESHHKLSIDEPTHERWRQVMGLMREVDTHADNSSDYSHTLEELAHFQTFHNRYPALSPENNKEIHTKLLQRARSILALGQQIAQATTIGSFIRLRVREGMYTAHLFADTASQEVASHQNFPALLHTFRALGASSSLLDSSADLTRDYQSKQSKLTPTLTHRRKLLGTASVYTAQIIRPARHWRVIKEAGRAASTQLSRKIQVAKHNT